ncbi:MAG: hypothetical protein Fur0018_14890 [Anaerolineales bacterium]
MFFTRATSIGIIPTAGQRPFTYAALDDDLHLLALGEGDFEAAASFAAGQRAAFVAISAPPRPNQGVMRTQEQRATLNPAPRPGRWENCRVAEYLLSIEGIPIPLTPNSAQASPRWKQMGMKLFQTLAAQGYTAYPAEAAPERQILETYPHAVFTRLLGHPPFVKHTLEGRIQRQLVLCERRVDLPNPMRIFEEITRHRLLQGILPLESLHTPAELDALAAAYLAWQAAHHPEEISLLGDPAEGQIALPHRHSPP